MTQFENTKALIGTLQWLNKHLEREPFDLKSTVRFCLPLHQHMRGQLTLYYSTDDPMGVSGLGQHGGIQGAVTEEIERLHPDNPAQSAIMQELKQTIAAYFEAYSKRAKDVEVCDLAALRDDIKEQLEGEIEQKREAMLQRENARLIPRILDKIHKLEDELEYIDFYERNLLDDIRIYLERFCEWVFPDITAASTESQSDTPDCSRDTLTQGENKFCSGMPLSYAYDHFIKLATFKSTNLRPYLSEEQFAEFFRRAFKDEKAEKQTLTMGREAGTVRYLFYQFYEVARKQYEDTSNCKKKYVRLLNDNLNGFPYKTTFSNFAKEPGRKIR